MRDGERHGEGVECLAGSIPRVGYPAGREDTPASPDNLPRPSLASPQNRGEAGGEHARGVLGRSGVTGALGAQFGQEGQFGHQQAVRQLVRVVQVRRVQRRLLEPYPS